VFVAEGDSRFLTRTLTAYGYRHQSARTCAVGGSVPAVLAAA